MNRVIITDGDRTLVDDTNYNLSFYEAVQSLLVGKDIIAQPFADFSSDQLEDLCPSSETILAADFKGKSYQEIGEFLMSYENFGTL